MGPTWWSCRTQRSASSGGAQASQTTHGGLIPDKCVSDPIFDSLVNHKKLPLNTHDPCWSQDGVTGVMSCCQQCGRPRNLLPYRTPSSAAQPCSSAHSSPLSKWGRMQQKRQMRRAALRPSVACGSRSRRYMRRWCCRCAILACFSSWACRCACSTRSKLWPFHVYSNSTGAGSLLNLAVLCPGPSLTAALWARVP